MHWLIIIAAIAWYVFGDPPKTVANWFWDDRAAPWESVDAFYYPSRADLTKHREALDLDDVQACRDWAYAEATRNRDPGMQRGTYECGVGRLDDWGGLRVYRLIVD